MGPSVKVQVLEGKTFFVTTRGLTSTRGSQDLVKRCFVWCLRITIQGAHIGVETRMCPVRQGLGRSF
jgi:hypothetical protein